MRLSPLAGASRAVAELSVCPSLGWELPRARRSAGKRASDPLWPVPCGDSFILLQCRRG